jgi:hypothetical protein
MKDLSNFKKQLWAVVVILTFFVTGALGQTYTLTDNDVVVEEGLIKSCSYSFELKNIIIPETLDGQTVTGTGSSVFYNKGLTSVKLPATIKIIGNAAFRSNSITNLDFSGGTALITVEDNAFLSNALTSLDLTNFSSLKNIGIYAFGSNKIENLSLTGCTELTKIGNYAFYNNKIKTLNLSPCTSLNNIGVNAFYQLNSSLTSVDITGCKSLLSIEANAFNWFSGGFELPEVTYSGNSYTTWKDGNNNSYTAGTDLATNFSTFYIAVIPYTLTDDDVVVEDGVIKGCSYNFELKNIIIPETLDGQTVTGIADANNSSSGIFYNKGITTLKLPATTEFIGKYSFYNNPISDLDLSGGDSLKSIRYYAFANGNIREIDFSGCTVLDTIGSYSFYENELDSLELSNCKKLNIIDYYAFYSNLLKYVDITGCESLVYINNAFHSNSSLSAFHLPEIIYNGTTYTTWKDGNGNSYEAGTDMATLTATFYRPFITYTLTDDDVVVEDGIIKSCSYSFELKNIIIPETLDVQAIKGIYGSGYPGDGVFYQKDITSVKLPSTIEIIMGNAFAGNDITVVDFSECANLKHIERQAFQGNNITQLNLSKCTSLLSIGASAFSNNKLTSLDLSNCSSLIYIGYSAFSSNSIPGFHLPEVTYNGQIYSVWKDGNGNSINAGINQVSDFSTYYATFIPYTLTDDDVVVENGIIKTCSYNFELKNIVIPETLGGQTIKGIYGSGYPGDGVFYQKDIASVKLPSTIEKIMGHAFASNDITVVDFSDCSNLKQIDRSAFGFNNLIALNLSNCASLMSIGASAFSNNKLTSLDLSACKSLIYIGYSAFSNNSVPGFHLSEVTYDGKVYNEWEDGNGNSFIAGTDQVTNFNTYFILPIPYILTNEDADVTEGIITKYNINFPVKNIIIPQILDGQNLTGIKSGIFYDKGISSIKLPESFLQGYFYSYWFDGYGSIYNSGDIITIFNTSYYRRMPDIQEVFSRYAPTNGNKEIAISGKNFETQKYNKEVLINGVEALEFTLWSDTLIKLICPPNPKGTAEIKILLENGMEYISPKDLYYSDDIDYEVCGQVSGTWMAGKTYLLTCNVTIPYDSTLTIEEGVNVIALANEEIYLESIGTLKVTGIKANPVIFSSTTGIPGSWKGIWIKQEALIDWANISDATNGIMVSYDKTVDITNCNISGNSLNGVYAEDGGNYDYYGVRVLNSVIENNGEFGVFYYSVTEGNAYGTVENCIISNNKQGGVKIIAQGGSVGIGLVPAYKIANCYPTIRNNKIFNNAGFGLHCAASGYISSSSGAVRAARIEPEIYQNLVYNNSEGGIFFNEEVEASYNFAEVYNNTFWNNGNIAIQYQSGQPKIANNIFSGETEQQILNLGDSLKINYCNLMQEFPGVGNISTDPLFVSPETGDFTLQTASPCIDAGSNEFATFEKDFDDKIRNWDGNGDGTVTVDIGAFEFGSITETAPLISVQPVGGSFCPGSTVKLSVEVTSYPEPDFQWYRNDTIINEATVNELILTEPKSGNYTCLIFNTLGSVTTEPVRVSFFPVYDVFLEETICQGESFEIRGEFYASDTIIVQNLLSIYGCDSVVNLTLTIKDCTMNCEKLHFSAGWNIFSANSMPDSLNLKTIFQPLINNSLVKIQDEEGNSMENWGIFGGWQNYIGNISPAEGYKIKTSNHDSLEICGALVEYPFAIPLKSGWNIIGYPQTSAFDGLEVVQQLIDRGTLVKVQDEKGNSIEDWGVFGSWQNNIHNFVPGEGYTLKVSADDTLWISEGYTKSSSVLPQVTATTHFKTEFAGNGVDHMNIHLIGLPENVLHAGDELAIFDGSNCVGAITILPHHLQSKTASIAASAMDNQGMPGFAEGNLITLKMWNADNNQEFVLEPEIIKGTTTFAKYETTLASLEKYTTTGLENIAGFDLTEINCYPNPFRDEITIEIKLAKDSEVQVEVMNQLGQRVKFLQSEKILSSGVHRLAWNGRNAANQWVSPGIYHLKITIDEKQIHKKIVYSK